MSWKCRYLSNDFNAKLYKRRSRANFNQFVRRVVSRLNLKVGRENEDNFVISCGFVPVVLQQSGRENDHLQEGTNHRFFWMSIFPRDDRRQ
jgi:hypothetical protein